MKIKIGITGGIGSGKSAAAKIIRDSGYLVLDADSIAKEIMSSDESVKREIISTFGDESFIYDKPNRDFLASSVFTSVDNVRKINSIIHPPTIKKIYELLNKELERKDLAFVEAALIFESEMDEMLDYVLLVTASEKVRIDRIVKRDSYTEQQVMERMKFQMPETEKENLADFILKNESTIEDLETKTKFFLILFESMTKQ